MKDLCFLPLDIPKLEDVNTIISNFELADKEDYVWWNMQILLGERDFETPLGTRDYQWRSEARINYPNLIEWVNHFFPFKKLYYVHLARAYKAVLPHVDENYVESPFPHHMRISMEFKEHLKRNEPVGYRFILAGNRKSLYLCERYDSSYKSIIDQKKHYCEIPDSTNAFLIRNSEVPHGVDGATPDCNRLMGFLLGEVDVKKHQDLIAKSWLRYGNYAKRKIDIVG